MRVKVVGRRRSLFLMLLLFLLGACTWLEDSPALTPVAVEATLTPRVPVSTPVGSLLPTSLPFPSPEPTPRLPALTIWTTEQAGDLEQISVLAAEFAARAGIEITVIPKSVTGLRVDLITANLVEGAAPDLIWGNQEDLAGLLIDGQLQPVEFIVPMDELLPATLTSATRAGKLWGLPLTAQDFLVLLYNRALVAEPPRTTDELIVQSRAIRGGAYHGIVTAWIEARWLLAWLNGAGGAPTTLDGEWPTLNTPQMIDALNLIRELRGAAPPEQHTYADSRTLFRTGQVGLTIDGDWAVASYTGPDALPDVGIAPMPYVPATGRRATSVFGSSYLMFQRNLEGDELAYAQDFARFLIEPETQIRLARDLGRLPALRSVLTDPAVVDNPLLAAAAAQAEDASGLPPTRGFRCALRAINLQLRAVFDDTITQEQIAQAMQQSAEACMAE